MCSCILPCIEKILTLFSATTDMTINVIKSDVYLPYEKEESMTLLSNMFHFTIKVLKEGLQYMGFTIKPNKYGITNWSWIISKVEKKFNHWCNRWISRGGRLVLIKIILEVILVYLHILTLILKGIVYQIKKNCFNYLWKGRLVYKGSHLVNWRIPSKPKFMGGWG